MVPRRFLPWHRARYQHAITPMAVYTESLLESEPGLNPRVAEYLQLARRALSDVAHTVGRMGEFYRQRDRDSMIEAVQLNPLIQQVLDLTRARWNDMPQQRGIVIKVQTELAAELPGHLGHRERNQGSSGEPGSERGGCDAGRGNDNFPD